MHNLVISFSRPQLKINGQLFEVQRSDAAILQGLIDIDAEYAGQDMTQAESILSKSKRMLDYIDAILGPGAAERIAGGIDGMAGYELGIAGADAILTQISAAAVQAYSEAIAAKYDD